MVELTSGQVDPIVNVLVKAGLVARNDAGDFENWLNYIAAEIIAKNENEDVKTKKRLFNKYIGSELAIVQQEQGELEWLLNCALEAALKGLAPVVNNLISLLLGRYWERMFCSEFTRQTLPPGYIYRFQKHQNVGKSRFAYGTDTVGWKSVWTPDVLFTYNGCWVMGEIKHITENESHCYYMAKNDYEADMKLVNIQPTIPLWFIVHDHKHHKWAIENKPSDWRVGEIITLGEPIKKGIKPSATHFEGGDNQVMCCWPIDKFKTLADAIEGLENAEKS